MVALNLASSPVSLSGTAAHSDSAVLSFHGTHERQGTGHGLKSHTLNFLIPIASLPKKFSVNHRT